MRPEHPVLWLAAIADPTKLALLRALARSGMPTTVSQLADDCEASAATIRRHLEALVALNVVTQEDVGSVGRHGGRPATRYGLPSSTQTSVCALLEPGQTTAAERTSRHQIRP
jgi:predicted ArsR family transcriptional regulator